MRSSDLIGARVFRIRTARIGFRPFATPWLPSWWRLGPSARRPYTEPKAAVLEPFASQPFVFPLLWTLRLLDSRGPVLGVEEKIVNAMEIIRIPVKPSSSPPPPPPTPSLT